jgi:hypothetical protein
MYTQLRWQQVRAALHMQQQEQAALARTTHQRLHSHSKIAR